MRRALLTSDPGFARQVWGYEWAALPMTATVTATSEKRFGKVLFLVLVRTLLTFDLGPGPVIGSLLLRNDAGDAMANFCGALRLSNTLEGICNSSNNSGAYDKTNDCLTVVCSA